MTVTQAAPEPTLPLPPGLARIALFERDKPEARRLARLLRTAAQDVEIHTEVSSTSLTRAAGGHLVVASYDCLAPEERAPFFGSLASLRESGRLLLYTTEGDRQNLLALLGRWGLTNVLAGEKALVRGELLTTVQKILRQDIFGIEKYMAWAAWSVSFTITKSADRTVALDLACQFTDHLQLSRRFAEPIRTIADELVANAIYDAPTDPEGQPRHANTPRTEAVSLKAGEVVEMTLSADKDKVGLAVRDPFGSLTPWTVQRYLAKCFRGGPDQVDQKVGGAGLGLFQSFEAVSHFVVNVSVGRQTEVIGLVNISGTAKELAASGKSFNIFVETDPLLEPNSTR